MTKTPNRDSARTRRPETETLYRDRDGQRAHLRGCPHIVGLERRRRSPRVTPRSRSAAGRGPSSTGVGRIPQSSIDGALREFGASPEVRPRMIKLLKGRRVGRGAPAAEPGLPRPGQGRATASPGPARPTCRSATSSCRWPETTAPGATHGQRAVGRALRRVLPGAREERHLHLRLSRTPALPGTVSGRSPEPGRPAWTTRPVPARGVTRVGTVIDLRSDTVTVPPPRCARRWRPRRSGTTSTTRTPRSTRSRSGPPSCSATRPASSARRAP